MVVSSNRVPEPKRFSSWRRDPSTSSPIQRSSVAISRDTETPRSSRYILPRDLDTAIQQLDDQELERLVLVALEERARRKKPLVQEVQRKRDSEAVAVSLPQGKLNVVRAAFKAGVTPTRIAREFGLSRSDVQRALAGEARKQ
jgi:DNA-directed RNA polymerase specialized sigma subunit